MANELSTMRRSVTCNSRNLVRDARPSGVEHLIMMSIVGIDRIPLPYYRYKLDSEHVVEESSIPYSVLRATQFHDLLDQVFSAQRFFPVLLAPSVPLQPIAVEDVAVRLVELTAGPAAGRVGDIGGPEQLPLPELARRWKQATGSRRPVMPIRLPGKAFRAFAGGAAAADDAPYGKKTFDDYLAEVKK